MKYFTKLLSMLLVGVMLSVTACTDYDQDIKDLNNKVDALEKELVEGQINPLKADLAATKAALEAAIADANDKIAENKAAVEALKEVDEQHSEAIADAQEAIADALVAIGDLDEKHDGDIKAVNGKIDEANKAINAAVERISANEDAIVALKSEDAKLAEGIANALLAIEANKKSIEANKESISELSTNLLDLSGQFTAYKAEMAATIATLESRLETAEAAIEVLEGNVAELYDLHDVQGQLIENLDGRLEDLAAYTEAELEALRQADLALNDLIVNLDTRFQSFQTLVNEQFTKAFGQIAANTAAINALQAKHDEEVKSLQAQDAAILETLELYRGWLAELDENVEELYQMHDNQNLLIQALDSRLEALAAYTQEQIDALNAAIKALDKKIDQVKMDLESQVARVDEHVAKALAAALEAAANAEDNAKAYTDALAKSVEASLGKLAEQLDQLNTYAVSIEEALNEYKEANDAALDGLRGDMTALLNRVQSIVFVPEYTDGKATINWATAGATADETKQAVEIVEARSVLEYQVYPAECAIAITADNLKFDIKPLKTRAAAEENYALNVVSVDYDKEGSGRIYVSVDARGLGEDFYAGDKEYAISLVLNDGTANLASCFVNAIANPEPDEIEMNIMKKEVTSGEVKKITDTINPTHRIEYVDTEKKVTILDGHFVRFSVAGETYDSIEALQAAGYDIEMDVEYDGYSSRSADDVEPFDYVLDEKGQMVVSVVTVDKKYIYDEADAEAKNNMVAFRYIYTARGLSAFAGSRVCTIPVQASVNLADAKIRWDYDLDAVVDANPETLDYKRSMALDVVSTTDLPEDTTVADVIKNGVVTEVTVDDEVLTAESKLKINLFINGDDKNPTLQITNWDWTAGKYNVAVTYHLQNVDVVVKFVLAVDPYNNVDIVLKKNDTVTLEKDITFPVFSEVTAPMSLQDLHSMIAANNYLGSYANAEDYAGFLAEVLGNAVNPKTGTVTSPEVKVTIEATDGVTTVTKVAGESWATNMKIAEDGDLASVGFKYSSFDFVPTTVTYTMDVTLWYGQKAQFIYTVEFVRPTIYNFKHNDLWVYFDQNLSYKYYSNAQGRYELSDHSVNKNSANVRYFAIDNINMDKVFNVVETIGDKFYVLQDTNTDFEDRGLVTEFEFVNAPVDTNITLVDKILNYDGRDEYVEVRGKLYLKHSNDAKIQLATSFDEGQAYCDYRVNKFDPLTDLAADQKVVYVPITEVKPYIVNVLENFSIYESRNGDGEKYALEGENGKFFVDLINSKGKWMTGSGKNGWYYGRTVEDMFGVVTTSYNDVATEIPQQYMNYVKWNKETGELSFDNTYNLELAVPVVIPVSYTVDYKWAPKGGKKADCTFVFYNPDNYTPAEE